jgi:pimeloyl-ACP methyl ester carboxylesterase
MNIIDTTVRATGGTARNDGIALAWEREGSGAPLLLIGGFNADRSFWAPARPLLAGRELLSFDNRDVGTSGLAGGDYSIADMARDALAVMDAAGVARADVLGHSMGGMIAQEVALAAPDRVRRLVLCNTIARNDVFTGELIVLMQEMRRQMDDRAFHAILHVFGLGRAYLESVPLSAAVEEALTVAPVQDAGGSIRQLEACLRFEALDRLGGIAAPTLVVESPEDAFFGSGHGAAIAAAIPAARRVRVGRGHCPMIEAPEDFAAAVEGFLGA